MTQTAPAARPAQRARPSRRRRPALKPLKSATIWVHRWISIVLGALLVVVTTTGAVLLYEPEIEHLAGTEQLEAPTPGLRAGQPPITLPDAYDRVEAYAPKLEPATVHYSFDTIVADNYDTGRRVTLDKQTGEVIGDRNINEPQGFVENFIAWNENIHLCLLTCEEYPGYQAWLAAEVPHTGWLGFEGTNVTWGGLVLGVLGLMLVFLGLSGIWLWWPTLRRWRHGFRVRLKRGRYARDFDLHQVVGMIAVPFLLMWGLTGVGFEFGWVAKAWYAVTPGSEFDDSVLSKKLDLDKGEKPPADIGPAAAMASAQRLVGDQDFIGVELPIAYKDDPTSTYTVYYADGVDPYKYGEYPGDVGIGIDRFTGKAEFNFAPPERPFTADLWDSWNYPTHAGIVVNSWWRVVWFVLGMVPLLLFVTGLSTWLFKRKVRKRKRQAVRARASTTESAPASVVDLDDDGNEVEVPTEELVASSGSKEGP